MITYFHRNIGAGYSINKVSQTIISRINDKEEYYAPTFRGGIKDVLNNIIYIRKHRNKKGYNHITGGIHYGIIGLIGCKSVLTIHDTGMVDYFQSSLLKKIMMEWLWFRIPLMFAHKVVCISNETKRCVSRYTKRTDIKVIYNAVDPSFRKVPKKFNAECPIILLIGTAPNKNLIKTFEALKGLHCTLKIIGNLSDEQRDCLTANKLSYINKKNLTDEEIRQEYENADIISFISKFEGFGMLIIEGNIVGRPVICSSIPVLKEVGNDAAFYVNPDKVSDIRKGFLEIINNDNLRNRLVCKGFKNVKRFSHEAILPQWLDLYKD